MKVALVTGAGKGIGKGFADFLSANGYIVYAGVHKLSHKNSEKQPNIRTLELDVQDDSSIAQAVEVIKKEQGRIDLLVNNAGLNKDSATSGHKELVTKLDSLTREALLRMFDVNAVSLLIVIKHSIGLMTDNPAFIINVSSDRASFTNAMNDSNANYGYKASKAALNMLSKVLVFDLPKNVHVVAVHPGSVHTNMNPNGTLEPAQAAAKIYQIIENWDPELNGRFVYNDGSIYPS
jgi:NAD(P)-dependent dehydrogenase (short-subunit alcohol dehydrogenase family)